ncbi:MAG: NADH-quinone oxidoreductase subunit M [cyanobacterium endosymbiont of Rhopalodia musculus]|uniref:NADH-quinone oxidoreductase subunit M n=1 Tax=cyanobacterium endosymbiont of Epithemia clementina EcSB TaxID=3034674 RepID=UPI0024800B1C|nr:NADH-quinone oxidoreductase subunit M [cyanobacterium endosymbiont of Epithemia clementina EcSB]WGT67203.1 NADH-quinone oxidoreductase subunit M [cyanobacterium endosymbiont of Epithemia clementina EcSB]
MVLSALIWIPLVGAILIAFWPGKLNSVHCRLLAMVIASIPLIINIILSFNFDPTNPNVQFTEYLPWITRIGLNYHLGVDGLSFPLIFLNSLLTLISIYASSQTIKRSRFYYVLILILNSGVMGAFVAQDVLLFFLFFELDIIPLYFLIGIWGGAKRGYASMKFLLYTTVAGILILTSFLGLAWFSELYNFDYETLRTHTLPLSTQLILLAPLIIGLGIKIPIFPFHTWLPDAHVEASTPISVLLAGILLKLGTYGLLRFGIGLFVDAWVFIGPWLATLASISALYGASCAILQKDMKRVVAYSSIAHMGYVLLAAAATTHLSITAATFQMVSHGLISALLFLLVGVVSEKTGSLDVDFLQGLLNPQRGLPITGSLMILGVMASVGIPGMAGFIAEFLVFRGSFPIFPIQTLLCLVGSGLTAVYFLLMVNRVFFGRLTPELAQLPRVLWSERIPAFVLSLCIVVLGLQPSWMVRWNETQVGVLLTGKPDIAVVMQQWRAERK